MTLSLLTSDTDCRREKEKAFRPRRGTYCHNTQEGEMYAVRLYLIHSRTRRDKNINFENLWPKIKSCSRSQLLQVHFSSDNVLRSCCLRNRGIVTHTITSEKRIHGHAFLETNQTHLIRMLSICSTYLKPDPGPESLQVSCHALRFARLIFIHTD